MTRPLDGLRVLDCSLGTAGPRASGMLADLGADVVWVEPPGGDPLRLRDPTAGPRAMGWGESDKSVGEQEASVEAGRSAIDQTASKLKPSPGATLAATVAGSSPSSHV
jgi:crotonobetainyl-CoA:carnitine CoA-transferase CaiB-like acyl-CoA transferase